MKSITDSKTLWKTAKPSFPDKQVQSSKISLVKGDDIIDDDKEVANIFNNFFTNIVQNLNKTMNDEHLPGTENLADNANMALKKYENHPSIVAISRLVTRKGNFSLSQVTYEKTEKFLRNLARYQEGWCRYSKKNKKRKF